MPGPVFQPADLLTLGPGLALIVGATLVLIPDLWARRRGAISAPLALLLAVATLALVVSIWVRGGPGDAPTAFAGTFVLDRFALFFDVVFLMAAILAMGISLHLLPHDDAQTGEYYALILYATAGMMFMASGLDLLVIWLGLELMALSSYVLCGYLRPSRRSSEAALKYFLLGAFSTGILLYGMSLIYGATGSTYLPAIRGALDAGTAGGGLFSLGVVLLIAGFGFKVAAVPFHQWAPDVYEGAPTGITAFISTAGKAAPLAAMLRIFAVGLWGSQVTDVWVPLVVVLAAASMVLGNVTALLQTNVKRMLAYSSIGHVGYILMGLVAVGSHLTRSGTGAMAGGRDELYRFGVASILIYALVYTFTNVGAFAVVAALRGCGLSGENVEDFAGLARRRPLLAFAMLVFLLSLAGIPATAGFIGKWYLFGAAIRADMAWLAVIGVVMSVVSAYYYLRVVVAMYMRPAPAGEEQAPVSGILTATVAMALGFTLLIGVFPQPFLDLASQGAAHLRLLPWLG
jgi:NADH-quinone oxidoreductase subunit N